MVDKFPLWQKLAISLGVPLNQVEAFKMQYMGVSVHYLIGEMGRAVKPIPECTWGFLLEVVEETEGSKPAEDLLELVCKT